jgi:hypothetical protein
MENKEERLDWPIEWTRSNSRSQSDDIRQFGEAFIEACWDFKPTGKSGINTHNKSKYAKLEEIYEAVQKSLWKRKIAIWHNREWEEGLEFLVTRLTHVISGQYIQDKCLLESEKPGSQGKGAALTYMKRYAVLNLCAIPTEEFDDDGVEEQKHIEEQQNKPIDSNQITIIKNLLTSIKNKSPERALEVWNELINEYQIEAIEDIRVKDFELIKKDLVNE